MNKSLMNLSIVVIMTIYLVILASLSACGNNYLTLRTMSDEIHTSTDHGKCENPRDKDQKKDNSP